MKKITSIIIIFLFILTAFLATYSPIVKSTNLVNNTNSPGAIGISHSYGVSNQDNAMVRGGAYSHFVNNGAWEYTNYYQDLNQYEGWPKQTLPPDNETILSVKLLCRAKSNDVFGYQINITFAYSLNYGSTWKNQITIYVTNATYQNYEDDITSNESWTPQMLKSENLCVKVSVQYNVYGINMLVDYIGLNYTWGTQNWSTGNYSADVFAPTAFDNPKYDYFVNINYGENDYLKLDGVGCSIIGGELTTLQYTNPSFVQFWPPWLHRADFVQNVTWFSRNKIHQNITSVNLLVIALIPQGKYVKIWADVNLWNDNNAFNHQTPSYYLNYTTGLFHAYEVNITSLFAWTPEVLINDVIVADRNNPNSAPRFNNIQVNCFVGNYNQYGTPDPGYGWGTPVNLDYLGLHYSWSVNVSGQAWKNYINPNQFVWFPHLKENIMGVVWLLFIFFPAIVLGEAVPKIGFIVGSALMLVFLALIIPGFIPISILGMIGISIVAYRGVR